MVTKKKEEEEPNYVKDMTDEEEYAGFDETRPQLEELERFVKTFGYVPMKTVVAAQRLPEKSQERCQAGIPVQ